MKKKSSFLFYSLIGLFLFSTILCCNDKEEEADAQFERADDWVVPANLSTFESHFFVESDIKSPFHDLPLKSDSEIGVTFCELWITGFEGDLSVLREVTLWIVNPENKRDRIECAYVDYIKNEYTTRIRLSPSLSNMYELAKMERYNLELELEFRNYSPTGFQIQLNTTFFVRY